MIASVSVRRFRAGLYTALGCLLSAGYFVLPSGSGQQHLVYELLGIYGVTGVLVGLRTYRPAGRAWSLIAVGLMLWVLGDTYWNVYALGTGAEAPFPSAADAFYLAAYAPLLLGMALIIRQGRPRSVDLVDAAVVGLAASLIVWFVAIQPVVHDTRLSTLSGLVAVSYPTMDYLLLLGLVQLLFAGEFRNRSLFWLTASFATVLATDLVYAWLRATGSFTTGSIVNGGYFLFYVFLGTAALSPSMASLSGLRDARSGRLTVRRTLLLAAALLSAPFVLIAESRHLDALDLTALGLIGSAISLLALLRLTLLFREREYADAKRLEAEKALKRMAYSDPLTGVANRSSFFDACSAVIDETGSDRTVALLFVDLDDFKHVNDDHGHAIGDAVLCEVAARLARGLRSHDLVARHGGDEFVVLLRELEPASAAAVAEEAAARLGGAVARPITVGEFQFVVSASIGIAVHPGGATTADELIRAADRAMYAAKRKADAPSPDLAA